MNIFYTILGILCVVLFTIYVLIISRRNSYKEALSNIDVQLKKRSDLIPNVLAVANRFIKQETSILTDITTLRTEANKPFNHDAPEDIKQHFAAASQLSSKLNQLAIAVEAYPDLKSNQTMIEAMQSLNEVEAQIAAARRYYNSSVTDLNNIVQIFPGNIIASMLGVKEMPFYQAEEITRENIDVAKILS